MIVDLFKSCFSGPFSFRIFSVALLVLLVVWLWWGIRITTARQRNDTHQLKHLINESTSTVKDSLQESYDGIKDSLREEMDALYRRLQNEDGYPEKDAKIAFNKTFEAIKGNGISGLIKRDLEKKGCIYLVFTPESLGDENRKFFIFDLVGNITKNRISLYVNEQYKMVARFLMSDGHREDISVDIKGLEADKSYPVFAQWNTDDGRIQLIVGYEEYTRVIPGLHFDKLGPVIFKGIDFEGKFPGVFNKGGPRPSDILKNLGYKEYMPDHVKFNKSDQSKTENNKKVSQLRPYIDIEADKIELQEWSTEEKKANPTWPEQYQKIVLWFYIHNAADVPASNVTITAMSDMLVHKEVGRFSATNKGGTFGDRHVITKATPGRQPFTVGLDKGAVSYFKDGSIEIKLDVRVEYTGYSGEEKYWTRRVYVYSPIMANGAREIFSEGK